MANETTKILSTITAPSNAERAIASHFTSDHIPALRVNPKALLEKFPKGGPAMAKYVAMAITADSGLIDSILESSQLASPDQAAAIGAGLARAVRTFAPNLAQSISDAVAKSGSLRTQISYNAIGSKTKVTARVVPQPVKIGLADSIGRSVNLDGAAGGGVIGSKRLTSQLGGGFEALLGQAAQPVFQTEIFNPVYHDPRMVTSEIATEPQNNGATSTSPTR